MDELTDNDLTDLTVNDLTENGLNRTHNESFDFFMSSGKDQIIEEFNISGTIQNERDSTEEDKTIEQISFNVKFFGVSLLPPMVDNYDTGGKSILTPMQARKHGFNYSSQLSAGFTVTAKAFTRNSDEPIVRQETEKEFHMASVPILIGTNKCHTRNMTKLQKMELQEDWLDSGGYCILKGNDGKGFEWVIDMIESRPYNYPHVFHNVGHEKELSRLEFLSKPGDGVENSKEIHIKHVLNDNIYLKFNSHVHLKELNIPFYYIFYVLGMNNDREITENIVYKSTNDTEYYYIADKMMSMINGAFNANDEVFGPRKRTEQFEIIEHFAEVVQKKLRGVVVEGDVENNSTYNYIKKDFMNIIDKNLFPHIGLTRDTRHEKLRFLGHLIHKLFLVEMDILPSTDRDSLKNKRINPAGRAFAKSFKTQFNLAIVIPIKKQLTNDFKKIPFSQVPLKQSVKSAINGQDLERNLIQAITTGNKELNMFNTKIANRLASEMLYRKNQLNYLSTCRVIRTPNSTASNFSERSHEMRRVHGTFLRFIDPVSSAPTGDRVGVVKQLALMASISESTSSEVMKALLRSDPEIIPFDKVFVEEFYYNEFTKVMVNGYIVGCCKDPIHIVQKYREMRRGYEYVQASGKERIHGYKHVGRPLVNQTTSIYWDYQSNEILFWCDADRMLAPFVVVRNNTDLDPIGQSKAPFKYDQFKDPNAGEKNCFMQWIEITKQDIADVKANKKNINDLCREGKIELISPEECENMYCAFDLAELNKNKNNALERFTHCSFRIGTVGLQALTCPFASHNQIPRLIYQTNQSKQACGINCLNYYHRIDKHAFTQSYIQSPLVQTIANKFLYPNGMNAVTAIQSYTGYNQEDSIIFNRAASHRYLFGGIYSHIYSKEVEKNEIVGMPDQNITIDINKEANYSKLVNGLPRVGEIITKNNVIIAKYMPIQRTRNGQVFKDNSVIYKHDDVCIVEQVIRSKNQDNEEYIKIKLITYRPLEIGSKCSSRAGQKGEVGMGLAAIDMPFSKSGLIPDIIINPCAIPTRMTIGQLLEGMVGKACALMGRFIDATIFNRECIDLPNIASILRKFGFNGFGNEKLFCGFNGRWIDIEVFITPTYYQLLQKFVDDDMYAISSGPTCAITRQPLEGAAKDGGLRIGEMETWTLVSHGSSHFLMEKFRENSDGFDIYVCRNCGQMPVVNEKKNIYRCNTCLSRNSQPDIVKIRSSWASKLFLQEVQACGISVTLGVEKYKSEVRL